jgi:aspartyl-tRNA(Asn)/glutamyl-tRNA(Gln) amidotransferase subunit C
MSRWCRQGNPYVTYERQHNALIVKINLNNHHKPRKQTSPLVVSGFSLVGLLVHLPAAPPTTTKSANQGETGHPRIVGVPEISRADVAHLARLARIAMSDDELDAMAGQLGVILGAVSRVQEVAAADIPPTSHAVAMTNVLRPDVPAPSLSAAEALAAAPAAEDDRFRVPRILDEQ